MTPAHPTIVNDLFAPRMAVFYSAYFVGAGLFLPFFPVWLAAKGLDAAAIGVVLAAPAFVRVLAIPAGTRLADRLHAPKALMIAACAASAVGLFVLGFANGFVAILTVVVLLNLAAAPVLPLGDAYALRGLAARAHSYGPVRAWGSVAFLGANLGGGFLLQLMAPGNLIWPIAMAQGTLAVAAFALAPLGPELQARDAHAPHHGHLRDPKFLGLAVATSLVHASHAVYYSFSTIDWAAKGLGGPTIGALWALGVLAEIALFAVSGRLPAAIGPMALIMIGAAGAVLRWTAMAFDPGLYSLPALQLLHGLTFGAIHLGTMQFLSLNAPPGGRAAAQGDMAVAYNVMMAFTTMLAGVLYGAYGGAAYGAMALLAAAGGAIALFMGTLQRNVSSP